MMLEAGLNSVDITPYLVEEYWWCVASDYGWRGLTPPTGTGQLQIRKAMERLLKIIKSS